MPQSHARPHEPRRGQHPCVDRAEYALRHRVGGAHASNLTPFGSARSALAAPPRRVPPTKARAELEELAGVAEKRTQRSTTKENAMPTARLENPVLVQDEPLVFHRVLPGAGVNVEVQIWPDLRLVVRQSHADRTLLTGRYTRGCVTWDQQPTREAPGTAQEVLTADVKDALHLFHRRYVDPRIWTSVPSALVQL
jgi:hypothetical protein